MLTDKRFDLKQDSIYVECGLNLVAWKIPVEEYNLLTPEKNIWDPAFAVASLEQKLTRSTLQTNTKTNSRKVYEPVMNTFVKRWVKYNPYIPIAKKLEMYIHIDTGSIHHNTKPKTHPKPHKIDTTQSLQLTIHEEDALTGGRGKPDGVLRLESWVFICEIILDKDGKIAVDDKGKIQYTKPKTESDFLHWGKDSSTMDVLIKFAMKDAGKEVHIRNCYSNNIGNGPFGETIIQYIPR
jgi:hypothetical protein